MENYSEYKKTFLEEIRTDSAINGTDTQDEFLTYVLSILEEFDEISEPQKTGMGDKRCSGQRLMRADAFAFDETDKSLELFISDFQDSYDTDNLTMSRIDELYWRMYYFLDEICNGNMSSFYDDSDDVLKISRLIRYRLVTVPDTDPQQVLRIKMFVLTNKDLSKDVAKSNLLETSVRSGKRQKSVKTNKKIKRGDFNGKPLEINLWYPERFYEQEKSQSNEPVVIDFFQDYGCDGIPCLIGNIGNNAGYDAYLAIIPGKILAAIYNDHGSRVLEGNVRAFLGTSGSKSVNSGIRRTINTKPECFFTYNNGIATTASSVEINEINGQTLITKIVDLQIINGGQTTASLAEAVLKKTNPQLEGIFVSMKLTVIEDRDLENEDGVRYYDEMVKDIATFANSQNKVTAADLFSNDPFHIEMEKLSRKVIAPTVHYPVPTGWYYERSRKRYQQEISQKKNSAEKLKFQTRYPKEQVITKEALGMYLTALEQCPHIVAKGKNFVIKEFNRYINEEFKKNKFMFNEAWYKKCVCAAIIYRTIDNYLEKNKDSVKRPTGFWYKAGGYKLDIVPYTFSKIVNSVPNGYSLDWNYIWNCQDVSKAFMHEIEIVTKMINDFICDSHGVIVSEYCKRKETWEDCKKIKYFPSKEFMRELISVTVLKEQANAASRDNKDTKDLQKYMSIIQYGESNWQKLMEEGSRQNKLGFTDKTYLMKAAQIAKTGDIPMSGSGKISAAAMKTVEEIFRIKDNLEAYGIKIQNNEEEL